MYRICRVADYIGLLDPFQSKPIEKKKASYIIICNRE